MDVGAAGGGGDGFEAGFVEVGFHQGSGIVLDVVATQLFRQGDQVAVGGTDADGVDLESFLLGSLHSCRGGVPCEVDAERMRDVWQHVEWAAGESWPTLRQQLINIVT